MKKSPGVITNVAELDLDLAYSHLHLLRLDLGRLVQHFPLLSPFCFKLALSFGGSRGTIRHSISAFLTQLVYITPSGPGADLYFLV